MTVHRVHNFSAGPAALPLEVLEKAQAELTSFRGCGASIMELSHRGKEYIDVDAQATARLKKLLGIGDEFEVMYLGGGASQQFMMAPLNLLTKEQTADYAVTGEWAKKAAKEAKRYGSVNIAFTSEATNFNRVPQSATELKLTKGAAYVHFTSNNTIFGTEFFSEPETNGVPLVCDASSDFLSRPVDMSKYGLIYAGAQKNLGPSGVTIVLLRKDFLAASKATDIPTILDYKTHLGTMFNTPPVFPVYMVGLVLEWLEAKGGVAAMEKINIEKANLLYGEIDKDGFYRGTAEKTSRSRMNVTFRLPTEELENEFAKSSEKAGLIGLKGHRSVGGMRASIYNAVGMDSVQALVQFMQEFRRTKG
jgi:phosphoserine aminotransferase